MMAGLGREWKITKQNVHETDSQKLPISPNNWHCPTWFIIVLTSAYLDLSSPTRSSLRWFKGGYPFGSSPRVPPGPKMAVTGIVPSWLAPASILVPGGSGIHRPTHYIAHTYICTFPPLLHMLTSPWYLNLTVNSALNEEHVYSLPGGSGVHKPTEVSVAPPPSNTVRCCQLSP